MRRTPRYTETDERRHQATGEAFGAAAAILILVCLAIGGLALPLI